MSENINITIKDGKTTYQTVSTADLKMPSMSFDRLEDAQLAVAIAKALQARNNQNSTAGLFNQLLESVKYTFRILGLTDSEWTK